MHALATLGIVALSVTIAHTAALPPAFFASPPLQRRGCYNAGALESKFFPFQSLHRNLAPEATNVEVSADIVTTCTMADGYMLKPGEVWTRCSNWDGVSGGGSCMSACLQSCGGTTTFPGSTAVADMASQGICTASCPSRCKGIPDEPTEPEINRIDWAIRNDGVADAAVTFQACKDALETEHGGCDYGSEMNHGDFWYRIDPNQGACPA